MRRMYARKRKKKGEMRTGLDPVLREADAFCVELARAAGGGRGRPVVPGLFYSWH